MIRMFLVLLMAMLAFSAVSCDKGEYAPPAGMQAASDEKAAFCLFVPDDWTLDYSTAAAGAYYSKDDPSSVSLMAWELEHTDTTLDEWWEMNRAEISVVFSDVEEISAENTTLDGTYAKKYVYTAKLGEFSYKILQVACIEGGDVYLFTYTSLPDHYDAHLDDVEQILRYVVIK